MSKGGLLERLRGATRSLHDDLENDVDIHARLRTSAHYADHLSRLWRLHTTAEQVLSAVDFSSLGFSYPYPYRSSLLEQDLAFLGIDVKDLRAHARPRSPTLDTVAQGLGCMYVVEGSAKGARTILPAIRSSLDLDAERGASFFYGFGRETGRLWRACAGGIDAINAESEEGDSLIAAAEETFAMYRRGLVTDESVPLRGMTNGHHLKSWQLRHGHTT